MLGGDPGSGFVDKLVPREVAETAIGSASAIKMKNFRFHIVVSDVVGCPGKSNLTINGRVFND